MGLESRFGWHGFSFSHPDDWAPVSLTGNRREGYARLASPDRTACQVRWQRVQNPEGLRERLDVYLKRLSRDAKRAKQTLRSTIRQEGGRLVYHWTGQGQGRGTLFFDPKTERIFFLEVNGERKASLLPIARRLNESFHVGEKEGREFWSVFGLGVWIPAGAKLEGRRFESGRTRLMFRRGAAKIQAERWAFGRQLIDRHGFENWCRQALRLADFEAEAEPQGWVFRKPPKLGGLVGPQVVRVMFQEEANQLVALRVRGWIRGGGPSWNWFA